MGQRKYINITGNKYGRLIVTRKDVDKYNKVIWVCLCDCGKERKSYRYDLEKGRTKSCGCLLSENIRAKTKTHGMSLSAEYRIYSGIIKRCSHPELRAHKNYAGRGISVCTRWLESFENFYADMGNRPSKNHSIDRIDNNGNYEPDNCRWATRIEQSKNRRVSLVYIVNGKKLSLMEIAKENNMTYKKLNYRIRNMGMTIEDAITWKRKRS